MAVAVLSLLLANMRNRPMKRGLKPFFFFSLFFMSIVKNMCERLIRTKRWNAHRKFLYFSNKTEAIRKRTEWTESFVAKKEHAQRKEQQEQMIKEKAEETNSWYDGLIWGPLNTYIRFINVLRTLAECWEIEPYRIINGNPFQLKAIFQRMWRKRPKGEQSIDWKENVQKAKIDDVQFKLWLTTRTYCEKTI